MNAEPKIIINKIGFSEVVNEVRELNPDFFSHFINVFENCKPNQKYVYVIDFPYGYPIIEFGKMKLLAKERDSDYYLHEHKVEFKDTFGHGKEEQKWNTFVKDCEKNTDHPLSMVLDNMVEVFAEQQAGVYIKAKDRDKIHYPYKFPLNHIQTGQLFGVWGTIDMISKIPPPERSEWHASAGKSCFEFLFPVTEGGKSNEFYRHCCEIIFDGKVEKLTDAIHIIAKKLAGNTKTKILIFPEHYFLIDKNIDTKLCQSQKTEFQIFLFTYGWEQFKKQRELLWDNKELMRKLNYNHHDYRFQISNHFQEIVNCKGYALKLVGKDDKILYEVFRYLCVKFNEQTPRQKKQIKQFKSLLDYNTPFFFYYDTLKEDKNQWALVPFYGPAINTYIPNETTQLSEQLLTTATKEKMGHLKSNCKKQGRRTIDISVHDSQDRIMKFYKNYLGMGKPLKEFFEGDFDGIETPIKIQENKEFPLFREFFLIKIE